MRHPSGNTGMTLIELMIAVAIIGILTAIAIPAYRGYILTSQQGAAKANMEPLRIAIEDFFLDNGNYGAGGADKAAVQAAYNWAPDGDQNAWDYAVAVPGAAVGSNYDITVTHNTSGHGSTCPTNGACNDF